MTEGQSSDGAREVREEGCPQEAAQAVQVARRVLRSTTKRVREARNRAKLAEMQEVRVVIGDLAGEVVEWAGGHTVPNPLLCAAQAQRTPLLVMPPLSSVAAQGSRVAKGSTTARLSLTPNCPDGNEDSSGTEHPGYDCEADKGGSCSVNEIERPSDCALAAFVFDDMG